MSSLPRQYDIYLGLWRNDGEGLEKLEMTDLETNYSYYCSDEIPVGLFFQEAAGFGQVAHCCFKLGS
jgi:hypothetical protein